MHDPEEALKHEWKQMIHEIEKSQVIWNDETRNTFEEQYWEPIQSEVTIYFQSLDDLNETLVQIHHSLNQICV